VRAGVVRVEAEGLLELGEGLVGAAERLELAGHEIVNVLVPRVDAEGFFVARYGLVVASLRRQDSAHLAEHIGKLRVDS